MQRLLCVFSHRIRHVSCALAGICIQCISPVYNFVLGLERHATSRDLSEPLLRPGVLPAGDDGKGVSGDMGNPGLEETALLDKLRGVVDMTYLRRLDADLQEDLDLQQSAGDRPGWMKCMAMPSPLSLLRRYLLRLLADLGLHNHQQHQQLADSEVLPEVDPGKADAQDDAAVSRQCGRCAALGVC